MLRRQAAVQLKRAEPASIGEQYRKETLIREKPFPRCPGPTKGERFFPLPSPAVVRPFLARTKG
jgi:hypothetical protein